MSDSTYGRARNQEVSPMVGPVMASNVCSQPEEAL
jgi:hypothetical protein